MKKGLNFRKFWLTLTTIACLSFNSMAGLIPYVSVISTNYQGNPVQINHPSASTTTMALRPIQPLQWDRTVTDRITFAVDLNYKQYFANAMDVKVKLNVKRWNISNQPLADSTVYLKVMYHPNMEADYNDKQVAQFSNAYKTRIRIDSIYVNGVSTLILPANLYIQNEILVDRFFNFNANNALVTSQAPTFIDFDCNSKMDAVKIKWNTVLGAKEYQLEWLHVNDYGASNTSGVPSVIDSNLVNYNFKFNSTRISTTNTSYDINLLFNRGWIVYRVRALGINGNPNTPLYSNWNLPNEGNIATTSALNKCHISENLAHEDLMNWQYAATYAEEGKKKEVISYFDGSLRNRQTVTKINSDENVIVGETIYDHQGRPAVQVLPVPVADPSCQVYNENSIHFYPNFNKNEAGNGYSRKDFDTSTVDQSCVVSAGPMNTVSGASNYYSPINPDKSAEQGYVPDAKEFPFTQIEYTPDNTGRIRRQSGVGAEFKLGSGHETKYLYGQPDQLELDRLFGSEVGNTKHYKKNVVIDANGQASISYLDQEGRVIATALAGNEPTNLSPLNSALDANTNLTINAFGDNNNLNTVNIDGNGIEFTTSIVVPSPATYTFDYSFSIPPLTDTCLPNICIDCVYDLKLELVDECGVNWAPESYQNKLAGKFEIIDNITSFHALCADPLNGLSGTQPFTVENLPAGTYSLNKILTVHDAALQAYIDMYLDSTKNDCLKTLSDFNEEALANVDTSMCQLSCEDCLNNLGSLEEFVSSGQGTANDYYELYDECKNLCSNDDLNPCEIKYNMLLMDMAVGGQYGEYLNSTTNLVDFSIYPVSIYNSNNQMPNTNADWRNPQLIDQYGTHPIYVSSNGDTSKIIVINANGVWVPAVAPNASVKWDSQNQNNYIFPQELANVEDFIDAFEFSWAKSLVKYHPEYCYYETCIKFSEPSNESDAFTSESFDQLLLNTTTFQQAIQNGFISSGLNQNSAHPIEDWFAPLNQDPSNSAHAWDPFVFFDGIPNTACSNFGTQLANKFSNFTTINGQNYSMPQMAAYYARCEANFVNSPAPACLQFGAPYNGVMDPVILDKEWNYLKSFYRSAKQTLQQKLSDCIANQDCNLYCGCIGNPDFSPYSGGFGGSLLFNQQGQPCNNTLAPIYQLKQRRFPVTEEVVPSTDPNQVAYQAYLQTGQCPVPFALENLLNHLVQNNQLTAQQVHLNTYGELTSLFIANNNFASPGTIPSLYQTVTFSTNGDVLEADWTDNLNFSVLAHLTLQKPSNIAWSSIQGIDNLQTTTGINFTANAQVNTNGTNTTVQLLGSLTYFNLSACNFPDQCTTNDFGKDLEDIFNALNTGGQLNSSAPVDLNPYQLNGNTVNLQSNWITNASGIINANLHWQRVNATTFKIADPANPTNGLFISITNINPAGYSLAGATILNFSNLVSAGQHTFSIEANISNGDIVTLTGNILRKIQGLADVGIPVGKCDLPIPAECQTTEFNNLNSLLDVLKDVQSNQGLTSNTIDLFQSMYLSQSMINQWSYGLQHTTSNYNLTNDTLTIYAGNCLTTLTIPGNNNLSQVVELLSINVNGPSDYALNFHEFKITAKINQNGTIVNDIIKGSTCLNLKGCPICLDSSASSLNYDQVRQARLASGDYYLDSSMNAYDLYSQAIDSLNLSMNATSGSPNFIQKTSYENFVTQGYNLQIDNLLRYISGFIPANDTALVLNDLNKFVVDYGVGTNVLYEYTRYKTGVNRYNYRAQLQNAPLMTSINLTTFVNARVARSNSDYLKYLEQFPLSGQAVLGILTYLNATPTATTTEQSLYQQYTSAYLQFYNNQLAGSGPVCFEFEKYTPLLSFEDAYENNLLCTSEGMQIFQDYISTFASGDCPKSFPAKTMCSDSADLNTICAEQKTYSHYISLTSKINESPYAIQNGYYLPLAISSATAYSMSNYTDCMDAYLAYLDDYYLNLSPNTSIPPLSLEEFTPCQGIQKPENPCLDAYSQLTTCVISFNNWAKINAYAYPLQEQINFRAFIKAGACYCVDEYCARLQQIKDGLISFANANEFYQFLDPAEVCNKPCNPSPLPEFENPSPDDLESNITDDCVEMLINQALLNAKENYNHYIDSLKNELITRYMNHCMGVTETFNYTYNNKLYHFTLYYYDQAGNLIKTVPPEGVEIVPITASTDPLAIQIVNDRLQHQKNVFTNHRMATRYEYNSLNQLVAQSTPDTDLMNEFDMILPNGLPSNLTTNKIQMLNEHDGYLAGVIGTRGYLFKTSNGGTNWTRVYGLVGTDFSKVAMVNNTTGFAVGKKGIIVKTTDGGFNWDLINVWGTGNNQPLPDLNDIDIMSTGTNTYAVTVIGNNGFVYRSTDLNSFSSFNSGIGSNANLINIENDGNTQVILANNANGAIVYRKTGATTTWSSITNFNGVELAAMDSLSPTTIIAGGKEGRLFVNNWSNAGNGWKLFPSNLTEDITSLKFFNNLNGIAISGAKLYRTSDGGTNWILISGQTYTNLAKSADCSSIIAVGDNGKITMLLPVNGNNQTVVPIAHNLGNLNFDNVWVDRNGIASSSTTMIVTSASNHLYYTSNATSPTPVWINFNTGIPATIRGIQLNRSGSIADGLILTSSNKIYRFKTSGSNPVFTQIPITGNAQALTLNRITNSNLFVASLDNGTLNSITLNSSTNGATFNVLTNNLTNNYSALMGSLQNLKLIGTKTLHLKSVALPTYINTEETNDFRIDQLNALVYEPSNQRWIAGGADGAIYHLENNNFMVLKANKNNHDIHALKIFQNEMYAVGSSGYFSKLTFNNANNTYIDLKQTMTNGNFVENTIVDNLNDLAINGTAIYAVGKNGTVVFTPNYSMGGFAKFVTPTQNLTSIAAKIGSTKMIAAGANSKMFEISNSNFMELKEIFTREIKDVHFRNTSEGSIVGLNYTVRQTNDGGITWKTTLANASSQNNMVLARVWTLPSEKLLLFGNATPMLAQNQLATIISGTDLPTNVTAIDGFNDSLAVINKNGSTSEIRKMNLATLSFTNTKITLPNSTIKAVRFTDQGNFAITGTAGLFKYYAKNNALTYTTAPNLLANANLNDVAAIDNQTFVIVGDNGAYFHSKEPSINTSGNLTGLIWYAQNGIYTADPYNVVQASNVSVRTIAFSTATNGVLGGAYNSNFANYNNSAYCYVRKIYDANRYSARFFYDKLGRLVVSQNARQRNNNAGLSKKYSYTLYDALGRVIEAGEKTENTNAALQFTSIFGTYISELFVPNVIDDTKLNAWITSTTGAREEVTKSYYDQTTLPLPTTFVPNPLTQRKRIVHVTYEENFDGVDNTYDHATHYDYDIHGNVKSILQDNRKMALQFSAIASQRYKRMDYRYDLVSGNVHRMSLQNGQPDQWHHAYQYDADNRITAAYTNTRTPLIPSTQLSQAIENELIYNDDWEQDASYQYYDHGPLARTEIGNSKLQGFDYVYNLQGWMKGINSTGLDAAKDPGKDGLASTPGNLNPNANFPKDVTSFSLQYFNNDYAAINNATPFASVLSGSHPDANSSALYNGNIRFMQTTLSDPTTHQAMPMLNAYQYDQLNRLKASRSYETGLSNNTWNPTSYNNQYFNAFNYDAMGNILQQKRHSRNGTLIDDLSYHYQYNNGKLVRNRLYHLNDAQSNNSAFTDDIDNMLTFRPESDRINVNNNYNYDEEGRLVKDSSEQISKIVWRVDGKIKEIQRPVGNTKKLIKFDYDAMGHRIAKHVFNNATNMLERSTYYILDAQGNQLSTYDYEVTGSNVAQYNLKERHIFGSSRLGMRTDSLNLLTATVSNNYTHKLGSKYYEFSNHLGNVLTVFTDVKKALDNVSDNVVDGYEVQIVNVNDYSPFGAPLDGRTIQSDFYRYSFNGMEKDDEVKGLGNSYTTEFRQYDNRLGCWLSIDPKLEAGVSPYCSMDNNPIKYNDVLGLYTEKRAKRIANRAQKMGYTASYHENEKGGAKNDWIVNIQKENEQKTGVYQLNLMRGKFRGFEEKDFQSYDQIYKYFLGDANESNTFNKLNNTDYLYTNGAMSCHSPAGSMHETMVRNGWYAFGDATMMLGFHFATLGFGDLAIESLMASRISSYGYSSAKLTTNGIRLSKALASEAQMAEEGTIISREIRDASRLVAQYGGQTDDWVKMGSTSFSKTGTTFETHWYSNTKLGLNVEYKVKMIVFNYLKIK